MKNIWSSLQFKIPTVFVVSFLLIFLAVFGVFATIGKNLLEEHAYKQVTLSAQNIVSQLGNRVAFAESLAISLANLGETLPRDVEQHKQVVKHVLNVEGSESFIAGGGIWPAPNKYDPDIERRSFFWGRDEHGVLQYYDDYNNPQGPGYHHEEWYVPAKHLEAGQSFWSKSYMDPYSYQPMVTVTVPMYKNNEFYGVSTVDLKLEGLRSVLEKASSSFGGYAFAVDRNGKFLSFPEETLTKVFGTDAQGRKTEEFVAINTLAEKQPGFLSLAQSVMGTISSVIRTSENLKSKNNGLAARIAQDSYQIDAKEATLIATLIEQSKQKKYVSKVNSHEFYLEQDTLLGEPAYASVFEMPNTFWRIVTVMPYSKAIEASKIVYRNLITYIGAAILVSFVIMLFAVRKILVKPISGMSQQLQFFTEHDETLNKKLETTDNGELGRLVFWFNKRTDKLLETQDELRKTQNELEERVRDRTEKLLIEIENRVAQQEIKEKWASRIERQHAAVVELSRQNSLFSGDVSEAAKIINRTAAQVLDAARSSVWLFNDANRNMEAIDIYEKTRDAHSNGAVLDADDHPALFKALEVERSVVVLDIFSDERTVDLTQHAQAFGISSVLYSPFRVAGKLRGMICFEHAGEKRTWHNDEIRFGGEIADQFHQVLFNAERIQTDKKIRKLAFYDPLTELANRRFFQESLQHEIEVARRQQKYGSLLYLDLDSFKTLNDSLGHSIGDELLIQLSTRIKDALRKEDMAARLGGDEFVVLLTGEYTDRNLAMEQALSVAKKIQSAISEKYLLHGYEHVLTASIGISLYPEGNATVTDILRQADTAMYRAKDSGRNTITFYNAEFQKAADKRLGVAKVLRNALAQGPRVRVYQPQIDSFGNLVGAEALLRWMHPDRGTILPLDFVPIAEETGLILEIGKQVLHDACGFSKQFNLDRVAVNISPRQFRQPDFVKVVQNIIETANADPRVLMLEVTEGVVIDDIEDTIQKMNALKDLGIRFAIDDFGTGYSSLAYLKQLPLDQLKINDKFVRDVTSDTSDAIIVETIILMARHLGLNVVAEGVESTAQFEFLTEKECQMFQGYLFSYPLTREDFQTFFQRATPCSQLPESGQASQ